jgi:pyruvate/2-oxoacid:ferredoxin oxidoreductase beta subunit
VSIRGGLRFIHLYSPCPTGWGFSPDLSVKMARMAVQSRAFPLYEVENGFKYTLGESGDLPISDYLRAQNRFRHLTGGDLEIIQGRVDQEWKRLERRAAEF